MKLLLKTFVLLVTFVGRTLWLGMQAVARVACRWWQTLDEHVHRVELRDAFTGECLGLTKKQHKRLMYSMGTKDDRALMRAFREAQARREKLRDRRR
jgi:hypothetical protein